MSKGVLVDITKCFGCGACTVACKLWNEKKYDEVNKPTLGDKAQLVDINWTVVSKHDVTDAGGREYVATSITTFIAHRGNFRKLKDAVNNVKGEPRVKGMLTALAACFKE